MTIPSCLVPSVVWARARVREDLVDAGQLGPEDWLVWQFIDFARVDGIDDGVDLNVMNTPTRQ